VPAGAAAACAAIRPAHLLQAFRLLAFAGRIFARTRVPAALLPRLGACLRLAGALQAFGDHGRWVSGCW